MLGFAKGNKTWNKAADVCPSLTPPDVFLNRRLKRFIQKWRYYRLLPASTCHFFFFFTSTCSVVKPSPVVISETSYFLIKRGVSWRVFGVFFLFSSGFSPQVSEGDFQDSWIICSEGLGIGFVSSAERPRRRWSDGIVCYRSYFVEAVHCGSFSQLQTSVSRLWASPCGDCSPLLICQHLQGLKCL